ncbi:MAG: transporter related protein [Actinomycetia bacterium]|nr:transporter related protein [Actinomycetes bacterium]
MTARLECTGLAGGYGAATAFRDVDLAIEAGTIEALLGPNGAGKTTLLLTMAGFLPPKAGAVTVDQKQLKPGRPSLANKAGIVLVPDRRNIFTTLSVHDNLKVAAHKGGPKPDDMLELFPALEKRWTLRAGALSGGEQQMLAMARALIQEPKVLLIDEMSLGLAPLIVEALFATVDRIATELGCAVLLVEQHVGLALEIACSASVLNRGSIVLRGPAKELLNESERLEAAYFGTAESDGS